MTFRSSLPNPSSGGAERSSTDDAPSERRPLSQYILSDEERDDDFGWTIFDSSNEDANGNVDQPRFDASVLKRIKFFLSGEGAEKNDATSEDWKNDETGASAAASFLDDEESSASVRERVAYPFYDGSSNDAAQIGGRESVVESDRDSLNFADRAADFELIFDPRGVEKGTKKRLRFDPPASTIEDDENRDIAETAASEKNRAGATSAQDDAILRNDEGLGKNFTDPREEIDGWDALEDVDEGAKLRAEKETPRIDPVENLDETASEDVVLDGATVDDENASSEVSNAEENAPPRAFVVDFSDLIAESASKRSATEDAPFGTVLKNSLIRTSASPGQKRDAPTKTNKTENMGRAEDQVGKIASNADALSTEKTVDERVAELLTGVERRLNRGRARASNGRTTILRRFVQLAAKSERRRDDAEVASEKPLENRDAAETAFNAESAFDSPRDGVSYQAFDAFGDGVSIVAAPILSNLDAVYSATCATFDATIQKDCPAPRR